MRFAIHFLSLFVCLMASALVAKADVVHSVKFGSDPVAMVWGEARNAPLVAGPVMTGLLAPVDEADSVARFKLATNAPYRILAQRADGQPLRAEDLRAAGFDLALERVGPNARAAGQSVVQSNVAGLVVYASTERTAKSPGDPESQSLEFFASWEGVELPSGLVFTVLAD